MFYSLSLPLRVAKTMTVGCHRVATLQICKSCANRRSFRRQIVSLIAQTARWRLLAVMPLTAAAAVVAAADSVKMTQRSTEKHEDYTLRLRPMD